MILLHLHFTSIGAGGMGSAVVITLLTCHGFPTTQGNKGLGPNDDTTGRQARFNVLFCHEITSMKRQG